MNISTLILAAIAVLLIGAVGFGLTMGVRAYLRYRGKRVITCPETANHAAVHVDVVNAAREAVFGKQHIRLDQCSRWPERQNCGQDCLSQIEADPEGCMVWHLPENLPAVFQNFLPVCWNCFIAENYRRQRPEQLVDRTWERGAGGEYVPKEPAEDAPQKPVAGN